MTNAPNTQRGAALIVGLVLLVVLTVLAISAMRTATLDLTMAGNSQFRENAFQLAESGIQSTLRNAETNAIDWTLVPDCPGGPPPWSDADLTWSGAVEVPVLRGRYQTRLCHQDDTYDYGPMSIGSAAGSGIGFTQKHYRIESRGRTDQRNAEAIHAQGFYYAVME